MPITALPQSTVQLLGSTQVLTTSTSLVKELIDNALDAKATSIDITISKNTLDKLEVRDNGHGIPSEDFDSLGKRGHTSKLRTFEELKFIGGATLGFRGEALASAVQLGEVSITTKTKGEAVATKLTLKAPGGVHQQTRTSHPVGTTVSVLRFMYKIPVRKQTFEKEAPKTLAKIHQMLRSYALARPTVRFGLKVTNGGKGSWSFTPRPKDGIKEAVSQVIGRDAALECFEKKLALSELQSRDMESADQGAEDVSSQLTSHSLNGCFAIEAFLPKNDADASKVGTGQYLSIDSRPVSHERGTMKKVVTLFKNYIRGALSNPSEKLKNPFIRLNIKCPIASYDANVEPAKDDILFFNEFAVLNLAENLLKEVYGNFQHVAMVSTRKSLATKLDDFELLLARDPTPAPKESPLASASVNGPERLLPGSSSPKLRASSPTMEKSSTAAESLITEMEGSGNEEVGSGRRKWGFNMSRDFSEDVHDGRQIGRNIEEPAPDVSPSPQSGSDHVQDQNTFVPLNTRQREIFHSGDIRAFQPAVTRQYPSGRNRRLELDEEELLVERDPPLQRSCPNDFVSARNMSEDALVSSPPARSSKGPSRAREPNKPFVSPLITGESRVAPADRFVQTKLFGNNPRPQRHFNGDRAIPQIEPNPDLAWAMDFEQRKGDATRRRREELHLAQMEAKIFSSSAPPKSSPHKNRYNAAITFLEADQPPSESSRQPKEPFKTTLSDSDPRAFLMRRQKSLAAKKGQGGQRPMSRAKSARLPLEKTPAEQHLHHLVYTVQTSMEELQGAMEKLAKAECQGSQSSGLMMKPKEATVVARKVEEVVSSWMKTEEGMKYEAEYSFNSLLNSTLLST